MCVLTRSALCCCLGGRNKHLLLGSVSPPSGLPLSFVAMEEKKWVGLLERAEEGFSRRPLLMISLFPPHFGAVRVLVSHTPELPGKFVLGSHCPFISSWFILCCLEPWLMVFITRLCSLFTLCSATAAHTAQGETVRVWGLGVTSQPCFFLTSFRHRFPPPLCILSHNVG